MVITVAFVRVRLRAFTAVGLRTFSYRTLIVTHVLPFVALPGLPPFTFVPQLVTFMHVDSHVARIVTFYALRLRSVPGLRTFARVVLPVGCPVLVTTGYCAIHVLPVRSVPAADSRSDFRLHARVTPAVAAFRGCTFYVYAVDYCVLRFGLPAPVTVGFCWFTILPPLRALVLRSLVSPRITFRTFGSGFCSSGFYAVCTDFPLFDSFLRLILPFDSVCVVTTLHRLPVAGLLHAPGSRSSSHGYTPV